MGEMLVKLIIFFITDVVFIARPQCLSFVDFLPDNGAVFFIFAFDFHRQRNMVGIFADNRAQTPVIEELIFPFTEMQGDFGTA